MGTRRSGRARAQAAAVIVAIAVAMLCGLVVAANADVGPATITVTGLSPAGSFSPNGDGFEDSVLIAFSLDVPANVTATIEDESGTTLRTVASQVSFPSGSTYWQLSWDGRDSGGAMVPDGAYRVVLVALNASGIPTTDDEPILIDRRIPGAITAPSPGATLSGSVGFELTPTPGVDVQSVAFTLTSPTIGCSTAWIYAADPDGAFRTSFDTAASCGDGEAQLYALVQYVDETGAGHTWASPSRTVILDNPEEPEPPVLSTSRSGPQVFSPNGDGQEDGTGIAFCAIDQQDGSQLTATVRVLDGGGATVRTLFDQIIDPAPYCGWYAYYWSAGWDGLDDAGVGVADGGYAFELVVTDATGLAATESWPVEVDRRIPGSVTAPIEGSTLGAPAVLELTPTPGFEIDDVTFWLSSSTGSCSPSPLTEPAPDGVFRVELDTTSCGDGAATLSASVHFTDAVGVQHSWSPASVAVQLDNPAPPVLSVLRNGQPVFSPNGDGYDDATGVGVCATDVADGTQLALSVRVLDAGGSPVRILADEPREPSSYCGWYGYYSYLMWDGLDDGADPVADGAYTIEVVVTDASGLSVSQSLPVVVDRRVPGALTSPSPGATIAGTTTFELTPTPGFEIDEVAFWVSSSSGSCGPPAVTEPDGDGTFRLEIDTVACGDGPATVAVAAYYTDSTGVSHSWSPPSVPVVLANPAPPSLWTQSNGSQVFSPNGDGQDEIAGLLWCATDAVDGTQLSVSVRVLDAAGDPVRVLVDELREPSGYCGWYGYYSYTTWDGLDDDAIAVLDGDYTFEVRATDATGLTTTGSKPVTVDRRVPGALTAPAPGATLAGTPSFAFTPTPGITIDRVDVYFSNASASIYNASPDGVWRTTYPVGQLPVGPTTLTWVASWTDQLGGTHSYSGQFEVAIDPTTIPLDVSATPDTGQAPLDVAFAVSTSDPNSDPLQIRIDFADGSPIFTTTTLPPYDELVIDHRYDDPGVFPAFVSVSNGVGGYAARTVPITVEGAPNSPPVVSVSTSATSGAAPLATAVTINATDIDGDALRYKVDFGDGSSAVEGDLPAGPVAHTYVAPGTYLARTEVSDGQRTVVRTARIAVILSEPLSAIAGDDREVIAGDEVAFDGGGSRPAGAITSYEWNFGDGSGASGPTATHVFASPGTYTARLTVRSGSLSATDEATVVVSPVPPVPGLGVNVRSGSSPIGGADVLVIRGDGSRVSAVTAGDGAALLQGLDDGIVTVYIYAPGYQPTTAEATLSGGSGSIDVELVTGEVGAAQLDTHRLTYEEIVEIGIDPEAPENQNVYEFEINLYFVPASEDPEEVIPEPIPVPVYLGPPGVFLVDIPDVGVTPCSTGCSFGWGTGGGENYTVMPQLHYVESLPVIQWLVIPGRAKFLKEFFDVSLIVQNLASPSFTFEDGSADLDLPAGLTLAPTAVPQSATVAVGDIAGGSSRTVNWTVRGDAEGNHTVRAAYTGVLEPVGKPVRLEAVSATPLKVWGGSALTMEVQVDSCAVRLGPYQVDVILRNVTADVPIYNAEVELFDRPAGAPDWQAYYSLAPPKVQRTPAIPPGGSFTASFVVYPALGNEDVTQLELVPSSSFVRRTGGNVDIATTLTTRDLGNCTQLAYGSVETGLPNTDVSPNTAVVTWSDLDPTGSVGVESYELLGTSSLDEPLAPTRFGRVPASQHSVTLSSDLDQDLRYLTVVTHLQDGSVLHRHVLGEGPPRYVALGDSFSAGEGLPAFEPGSDSGGNNCHRSIGSYSRQIAGDPSLVDAFVPAEFHACSGAIAEDHHSYNPRNTGEPAQSVYLSEFTERVTVTMGGNDVGFGGLAAWCALSVNCGASGVEQVLKFSTQSLMSGIQTVSETLQCGVLVLSPSAQFQCDLADTVLGYIDPNPGPRSQSTDHLGDGVLRDRLSTLYASLLEKASNAEIYVGNYPLVVDSSNTPCSLRPDLPDPIPGVQVLELTGGEKAIVRSFTNDLNGQIAELVHEAGSPRLHPVDVNAEFGGLELCGPAGLNPQSGLNTMVLPGEICGAGTVGAISCSLHPNSYGQAAYYRAFRNAERGTIRSRSTILPAELHDVGVVAVDAGEDLRVQSTWAAGDVGLRVTGPDGTTYTRASVPAGATWTVTPTSEEVVIPGARSGDWTVAVVGTDVGPDGEAVTVFASSGAMPPESPTALASIESTDDGSRTVRLNGLGSSSPNGAITSYQWLFDDGTAGTGATVDHDFVGPGPYTVGLIVTDAAGQTASTVLDPIGFTNAPPVAVGESFSTEPGVALSVEAPGVLANDSDPDGDALSAALVDDVAHGTLTLGEGGSFAYLPAAGFTGTDAFTYRASDGLLTSDVVTVSIHVAPLGPPPVVVPGAASKVEGTGAGSVLQIPVTLSVASTQTVTAQWHTLFVPGASFAQADPGADYTAVASGSVSFAPGQTSAVVDVAVVGDVIAEADELVVVSFSNVVNAQLGGFYGLGLGSIVNDDVAVATPGSVSTVEGTGAGSVLHVPVTLSVPSSLPVTASWRTLFVPGASFAQADPAADYTAVASGTVTFAPGQTSTVVDVAVVGDVIAEADELVVVSFSNVVNARLGGYYGLGFGTITNDDIAVVVPGSGSAVEGTGIGSVLRIPVSLSVPSSRPVTASWRTLFVPGASFAQADPGADYAAVVSGTVTFAPGQTSAVVEITLVGDSVVEPDELVVAAFSNVVNGQLGGFYGLGIGAIVNDDR